MTATLPPDPASELTRSANDAFVEAMTRGFAISTAALLAGLVVAVTMIPRLPTALSLERRPLVSDQWTDGAPRAAVRRGCIERGRR